MLKQIQAGILTMVVVLIIVVVMIMIIVGIMITIVPAEHLVIEQVQVLVHLPQQWEFYFLYC